MSAPVADPNAVPDPSQVFADPSQMPAMQGGAEPMPAPAGDDPSAAPPEDPPHETGIDIEGEIAQAIETGCQMAVAASEHSGEEFMRFAQGVNFLAAALKDLQPQPDPGDAQVAVATLTTAQKQEQAQLQHAAQMHATERQAQAAASRPSPSGSSARG